MLRLRSCILYNFLSSPVTTPGFSLHRLLSATAVSPSPSFAIEEYLVDTCGLTRAQALKASTKLSHLKSRSRPDAVLTLLGGLGLSGADVAAVVAKDPKLLCAHAEKTLASNVAGLTALGVSRVEVAHLVSLAPNCFRCRSIVSKLQYYLHLLGSCDNVLRVLRGRSYLLASSVDRAVKPNVVFLRECGIDACDIVKLCLAAPWILGSNPERVREMAVRAEAVGVPRRSGMFRQALQAVAFLSEEKTAVKVNYLKNTFRWSDAEVRIAVSKAPNLLRWSKDMLQIKSEFLISEVGLEPAYVAHLPGLITYSLKGRLRPRYLVLKFLKENGLLDPSRSYYCTITIKEKVFMENFICPHKEAAPHLAEDYANACRGEVPARFRST